MSPYQKVLRKNRALFRRVGSHVGESRLERHAGDSGKASTRASVINRAETE